MTTPTLENMITIYIKSAAVERLKCGRPCEGTVRNTLVSARRFIRWAEGIGRPTWDTSSDSSSSISTVTASAITPRVIRLYLSSLLSSGMKPISASSFINHLQQLFARWMRPYYEDQGWGVPLFPTLCHRMHSSRYNRPSPELLAHVKAWYEGLAPDMFWFVATMMLEFGMRNGDIRHLTRDNFVESAGRMFLNYTPRKTAYTSGRVVRWPVHPQIWESFSILKPWTHKVTDAHFEKLNMSMRSLGFTGTKGAYELRKICIDHVYQKYGAEMATSISGDDIKTIIRYYADPSQPNMGEMRITDLL